VLKTKIFISLIEKLANEDQQMKKWIEDGEEDYMGSDKN
jgi:hypothetical protein